MKNLIERRNEFLMIFIITLLLTFLIKMFATNFMSELMILPLISSIYLIRSILLTIKLRKINVL